MDKVSDFAWVWGAGERRGPDGKVLPSFLALCAEGTVRKRYESIPKLLGQGGTQEPARWRQVR